MKQLRSFSYLEIYYDEKSRCLVQIWKGGFQGRNLKEGADATLEEFKKLPEGTEWVSDTRDLGVMTPEEKDWIVNNWQPRLFATKIKFMAMLIPSSIIAKMSLGAVNAQVPGTQLTIHSCSDLEGAIAWVEMERMRTQVA